MWSAWRYRVSTAPSGIRRPAFWMGSVNEVIRGPAVEKPKGASWNRS